MKLTKKEEKECLNAIQACLGLILTESQLDSLLKEHPDVIGEIKYWGINDTLCEEKVMNMISRNLLNKTVPTYGDKLDSDAFFEELNCAAKKNGYKTSS